MNGRGDKFERVNKMVVSLDICSSSRILEDLITTGNLQPLADAAVEMKEFISAMASDRNGLVYKFTGDGWIILFGEPYNAKHISEFITAVSAVYEHCYDTQIRPVLVEPPKMRGLKFGIDDGGLLKLRMDEKDEYIGRPINVACRLQGLITDLDIKAGYQALISDHSYVKIGRALGDFSPVETKRSLRNITAGEGGFSCYKLAVSKKSCHETTQLIGDWLTHAVRAPLSGPATA